VILRFLESQSAGNLVLQCSNNAIDIYALGSIVRNSKEMVMYTSIEDRINALLPYKNSSDLDCMMQGNHINTRLDSHITTFQY
jgi:hypothetical protein